MPNIKSAKKRLRQSVKRAPGSRAVSSKIKTSRRRFFEAIDAKDQAASDTAFKDYCSDLDKAAKTGRIKKNTAVRRKGRAADKLRALSA
ncbi:MAG: 30S ribosomal protein S20 [Verrucomicrobiota bacterium]